MILHPEEKKNGTRFDILTPKATFSCGAESREIAKQWVKAIEQHIPVAAEDLEPAAEAARVMAEAEQAEMDEDVSDNSEADQDEDVPDAAAEADMELVEKVEESESDKRLAQIAWRLLDSLSAIVRAEKYEPGNANDLREMGKDLLVRGMKMAIALEELQEAKEAKEKE